MNGFASQPVADLWIRPGRLSFFFRLSSRTSVSLRLSRLVLYVSSHPSVFAMEASQLYSRPALLDESRFDSNISVLAVSIHASFLS